MTNEQLYILLTSYQNRLADEVNRIRQSLPNDMEKYPGREILGYKQEGDFVILNGLKEFLSELNQGRESLTGVLRRNITMNKVK